MRCEQQQQLRGCLEHDVLVTLQLQQKCLFVMFAVSYIQQPSFFSHTLQQCSGILWVLYHAPIAAHA
jgi:hypothetical protein